MIFAKCNLFGLIFSVFMVTGCQQNQMDENQNDWTAPNSTHMESSRDFLTRVYSLVLSDSLSDEELASRFFDVDLKVLYQRAIFKDRELGEVGCVNTFDIFIDSQEAFCGFVVGKERESAGTVVPIHFSFDKEWGHYVEVVLRKAENQWKIIDIKYFCKNKNIDSLKKRIQTCQINNIWEIPKGNPIDNTVNKLH
jgi:hypothetical protein